MQILLVSIVVVALNIFPKVASAENIQIEFTEDDSYSIEVAHIDVGDTIKWLPKNEGHNVEFLIGPKTSSLPVKSKRDESHSVIFNLPRGLFVWLYSAWKHGDVRSSYRCNDLQSLESTKIIKLSPVATSVLKRLIKIAQ